MREKVCLLLLLVLLLTGCGAQKDAVKAEGPEQTRQQAMETAEPEVKSAAAETDQNMTATMVEKKARPLTEEEILTAYDRAVTAYSWFDLSPLQVTGGSHGGRWRCILPGGRPRDTGPGGPAHLSAERIFR